MFAGDLIDSFAASVVKARVDLPGGPHRSDRLRVHAFVQSFSSTTLGREGIGGTTIVECLTVCVSNYRHCAVYRAGRLDYVCAVDETLGEDIRAQSVAGQAKAGERYSEVSFPPKGHRRGRLETA